MVAQFFSVLFKAFFLSWFAITLLVFYPFFWWSFHCNPKKLHRAFRLKQYWARMLFWGTFSTIKIEGALPKNQPVVICPNHTSYLDIIVAYLCIREPFLFLGKAELLKWPLFGIFFKYMDIPVVRGSAASAKASLVAAEQAVAKGWSILIFPEGTISKNAPEMGSFKSGAFKLAQSCNIPVVPITFVGNYRVINIVRWWNYSLPGRIKAFIHTPVPAEDGEDAMKTRVKEIIASKLSWK